MADNNQTGNQGNQPNSTGAQSGGGEVQLSEEAITNLLHHDPLSSTPVPVPDAQPRPGQQQQPTGPQPPLHVQQPGQQPIPGQQPQPNQEMDQLRSTVADLQRQLAQRQAPNPPSQGAPPEYKLPEYNVTLPQQLAMALFGEDPNQRVMALQALLTAHARTVHQTIRSEFMEEMGNRFKALPQHFQGMQEVREAARTVFEDFYGTYQQFNQPELYPFITSVSRRLQQQNPGLFVGGWNQRARDAIAAEAAKVLGWQLQAPSNGQQGDPPPPPPQNGGRPPRTMPTGARPNAPQPTGQQKHIADMFD